MEAKLTNKVFVAKVVDSKIVANIKNVIYKAHISSNVTTYIYGEGGGPLHIERGSFSLMADTEQTIYFVRPYADTNYVLFINTRSGELGNNLIYNDYPIKMVNGYKIKTIGDCECEYLAIY